MLKQRLFKNAKGRSKTRSGAESQRWFEGLEKTITEPLFLELGGESKAWEYLISHTRQHDARLVF